MMLIVISVRVVAAVPDLEIPDHGSDTHSSSFSLSLEHGHEGSAGDDAADTHFHCHNCCAHAPMVVSSIPTTVMTKAPIVASFHPTIPSSSPVSTHFRPPRA